MEVSSPLGFLSSVSNDAIGTFSRVEVDPQVELRLRFPTLGVCTGMGNINGIRSGADTALMPLSGLKFLLGSVAEADG